MPPESRAHVPLEDANAGYDVRYLHDRFDRYFAEARRLAQLHRYDLEIFVGFETEAYTGYHAEVASLIDRFDPDMIVGSVHHVHDVLIDGSQQDYQRAAELSGGIEALYCDYFDVQLELIERFRPAVVGHFDLIRIHDPNYMQRWDVTEIRDRALRNLARIKELGLMLDLNVRAFAKGAHEPYVSAPWLRVAIEEGISVAPGDDSHGVASVGLHIEAGIEALVAMGGSTRWIKPALRTHRM